MSKPAGIRASVSRAAPSCVSQPSEAKQVASLAKRLGLEECLTAEQRGSLETLAPRLPGFVPWLEARNERASVKTLLTMLSSLPDSQKQPGWVLLEEVAGRRTGLEMIKPWLEQAVALVERASTESSKAELERVLDFVDRLIHGEARGVAGAWFDALRDLSPDLRMRAIQDTRFTPGKLLAAEELDGTARACSAVLRYGWAQLRLERDDDPVLRRLSRLLPSIDDCIESMDTEDAVSFLEWAALDPVRASCEYLTQPNHPTLSPTEACAQAVAGKAKASDRAPALAAFFERSGLLQTGLTLRALQPFLELCVRLPDAELGALAKKLADLPPHLLPGLLDERWRRTVRIRPLGEWAERMDSRLDELKRLPPVDATFVSWAGLLPEGARIGDSHLLGQGSFARARGVEGIVAKASHAVHQSLLPWDVKRRKAKAYARVTVEVVNRLRTAPEFAEHAHILPTTEATPAGILVQRFGQGAEIYDLEEPVRELALENIQAVVEATRSAKHALTAGAFFDERNLTNFRFDPVTGEILAWIDPVGVETHESW